MLDGLTPTCSATSATDKPRLVRASRNTRDRLGLRGIVNCLAPVFGIGPKRAAELSGVSEIEQANTERYPPSRPDLNFDCRLLLQPGGTASCSTKAKTQW